MPLYTGSVLSNENLSEEFEFAVSSAYRYVVLIYGVRFIPYCCRCKWVKVSGDEYKISSGVILEVKDDLPLVGVVQDIYLLNENKVMFKVDKHSTSFIPLHLSHIIGHTYWIMTPFHQKLFTTLICSFILQFIFEHLAYQNCLPAI